ncbi:MAG: hypothetical protein IPL73_15425 [Candidatus Obscuribacter sp.]|nr:hypothetical protein [Candidatus Obscuribacter sp.]
MFGNSGVGRLVLASQAFALMALFITSTSQAPAAEDLHLKKVCHSVRTLTQAFLLRLNAWKTSTLSKAKPQ